MRRSHSSLLFGLGLVIAIGCGSSSPRSGFDDPEQSTDPSNPDGGGGSSGFGGGTSPGLILTPKSATIIIDTAKNPTVPGTQLFAVTNNGTDVTGASSFVATDSSLGSFSGATFTSIASLPAGTLGKSTDVTAKSAAGNAVGTLTVVALRQTGESRDFFFTVPYQEAPAPARDVLKFSTNIKQADVAFSMDTTGSMSGSINNLQSSLQGTLLASLQAAIPNVGLAIVDFKDFGQFDPWSVMVRQTITTSLAAAKSAVGAMSASGGGDGPECSIGSMQYILDGKANTAAPAVAAHSSPVGTFGGVDFRAGSVPVVVNVTDAEWKEPSGDSSNTLAKLQTTFTASKAKFVGIIVGFDDGKADLLSDATGSNVPPAAFVGCAAGQCCTGQNGAARPPTGPGGSCRLNFLASGGSGVGNSVTQAIQAIAVGTTFDIKPILTNDPTNANNVDATKFIKSLRAMDEGDPANYCPAATAKDSDGDGIKDTFVQVKAGTPVCFEVIPNINTTVPPTKDPQFYNAIITVQGLPGALTLDTRSVLFLVPPTVGGVK